MAQKEWKREEMKQNQGRTEQNQRKKVQKKTGYRAVLAASMFLIAASAALSACQKSPAAETTAQTQAAEETEGAVSTALGAADRAGGEWHAVPQIPHGDPFPFEGDRRDEDALPV